MGTRLNQQRRFFEAIAAFEEARALEPGSAAASIGLGIAQFGVGRLAAAAAAYRRALRIEPGHAEAHHSLGKVHLARNAAGPAIAAFRRATAHAPDNPRFRVALGLAQILGGYLRAGLGNYEYRWAPGPSLRRRAYSRRSWDGARPLQGRSILLNSELGFGDMIQFARFVPLVARLGARVHLEAKLPLLRLFRASFPQIEGLHVQGGPLPRCEEFCTVPGLPFAFGTTLATISAEVPYLKTPMSWPRADLGSDRRARLIGIAWSGSAGHANDRNRSIPFGRFREIFRNCGASLVSLQEDMRASDRADFDAHPGLVRVIDGIRDFADTAFVIQALDLVISVDTSVAHLAGALGKPVWLLLPFSADCRWMINRSDSPWYPTMRLFRQPRPGEWDSVFHEVRAQIRLFLGTPAVGVSARQ